MEQVVRNTQVITLTDQAGLDGFPHELPAEFARLVREKLVEGQEVTVHHTQLIGVASAIAIFSGEEDVLASIRGNVYLGRLVEAGVVMLHPRTSDFRRLYYDLSGDEVHPDWRNGLSPF
jgi:hypothetical protein